MITDNIAAASTADASSGQQSAQSRLTESFDMFLSLLTTQLQNQDPLSPMDSEAFTRQLTQFSAVEQAIETNKQLGDLIGLMRTNETSTALGYLGREVEVESDHVHLGEEGGASFGYAIEKDAEVATVQVLDRAGRTIRTFVSPTGMGEHQLEWDGRDTTGARVPAGSYQIIVNAADAVGNPIATTTRVAGVVDAVEKSGTGYLLSVSGRLVPAENVETIQAVHSDTQASVS